MSELTGGAGPAAVGRAANSRATAAPGPVPVSASMPPAPAPTMRTPIDVWNNRMAREMARAQRAEAEAAEATDQRMREEQQRSAERRAGALQAAAQAQPTSSLPSSQRQPTTTAAQQQQQQQSLPQQPPPSQSQQPLGAYARDSGYRSAGRSAGGQTPSEPTYTTPVPPSYPTTRLPVQSEYGPSSTTPGGSMRPTTTGLRQSGATARERDQTSSQRAPPSRGTTQQSQPLPQQQQRQQQPTRESPSYTQSQPQQQRQQQQPISTSPAYVPQSSQQPTSSASQPTSRQTPQPATIAPPKTTEGAPQQTQEQRPNVSSFPHAFERWETLSSHWEGLTSYWIRRLEQNTEGIRNDITAQQMARQITDLSAAGANLFHAVVELQRLRASSERKFQRWFFETRAQQEKEHDEKARLREELEEERANKTDLTRAELDKRLAEQKRELQIAKDEATRAWNELGRREEEERQRTSALREGHPISIGGIQVYPMQGTISGGGSLQTTVTQGEGYSTRPAAGAAEGQREYSAFDPEDSSPTDTDPYTERPRQAGIRGGTNQYPPQATTPTPSSRMQAEQQQQQPSRPIQSMPMTSSAPVDASMPGGFYQQPGSNLYTARPPASRPVADILQSPVSDTFSDEGGYAVDEHGNQILDARGQPIPLRSATGATHSHTIRESMMSDVSGFSFEDDLPPEQIQPRMGQVSSHTAASSTVPPSSGAEASQRPPATLVQTPADYEGQGFDESHWEEISRHQHPTRLSDVLEEEDERSRTSQGSRSIFQATPDDSQDT